MTLLDSILTDNRKFVHPGACAPLIINQKKRFAIVTCMDSRLIDYLESAMGIEQGDAKIIRNSFKAAIEPLNEGALQALVAAVFMLGVEEIFVVGQQGCANTAINPEQMKADMIARGIPCQEIEIAIADLMHCHSALDCPEERVNEVVSEIRGNPLIPADVPVHGLLFSPVDGQLAIMVDGYQAQGFASSGTVFSASSTPCWV